jgi:hypothetical protein
MNNDRFDNFDLNNCPEFPPFEGLEIKPSATAQQNSATNSVTDRNNSVTTPRKLSFSSADDMAISAKAPDFLINDILETDSHGVIFGGSQSFKTFDVIAMAHSICTGNAFMGHEVFKTGKVIYICGEGKGALSRRFKALQITEGSFNGNLIVLNESIAIDSITAMQALKEAIQEINPVLVVFDTFSTLATGTSENDNNAVASTLGIVKDTCTTGICSSIIVHHTGKDASRGTRGAYAFEGNTDFLIEMERVPDSMNTVMKSKKMKDGENFSDIYMIAHVVELGLIRQDGKMTTSLILKKSELAPAEKINGKPLDVVSKNILSAIHEAIEKNGVEPTKEIRARFPDSPKNCPVTVVHIDHLRPFAYPFLNVADNSKRLTLKRGIEKLELHGKTMFFNDYVWIAY